MRDSSTSKLIYSTHEDLFYTIFISSATIISLFSNSFLIIIIYISSSSHLGKYRFLLGIFACCNMFTSLMHAVFHPIVQLTSTGLYALSLHAGRWKCFGFSLDTPLCLLFVATFQQTFLILAYHHVYRYKIVTSTLRSSCTDRWSARQWSIIGITVDALYIGMFMLICVAFVPNEWTRNNVPAELEESYGIDLRNPDTGYIAVVGLRPCNETSRDLCWQSDAMIAIAANLVLCGGTAIVVGYCIHQTHAAIRLVAGVLEIQYATNFSSASNAITAKTRRMQRDLFNALLIQTAVPLLFSYLPLAVIILFPLLSGIALGDIGNGLFSVTAVFPAIDSFFVLFFISSFRHAVIRIFRRPRNSSDTEGSSSKHNNSKIAVIPHKTSFQNTKM